jgi:hypothetical protein
MYQEIDQMQTEYPNAIAHKIISFVKSGIRITSAIIAAVTMDAMTAIHILAVGLLAAEVVGIIEEMV